MGSNGLGNDLLHKNSFNEGLPVGFFIPVKDTLGEDHVLFSEVYIEIIGIQQKNRRILCTLYHVKFDVKYKICT